MQKRAALSALLFLASAMSLGATPTRPLTPDDFYNIQTVGDPHVSPDGKWVAYVVSRNDRAADEGRNSVWMASWDGTQQVQLTNPAKGTDTPRWSPDGRYLAYLANGGAANVAGGASAGVGAAAGAGGAGADRAQDVSQDKTQVMLLDRRGGEPQALTHVGDEILGYEWSPDSQRLVLVMEQATLENSNAPVTGGTTKTAEIPKPVVIDTFHFKEDKDGYLGTGHGRHLYLLDLATRKVEPLTRDPAFNEDLPAWSPDGRRLAFVRTREKGPDTDGMEDIDLIDTQAGATASKLLRTFAPNQQKLAWSSDGKALAYLVGAEAKYGQYIQDHLYVVKTAEPGKPLRVAGTLDRAIGSYAFGKDPGEVNVTVMDDGTAYAGVISLRGESPVRKLTQGNSVATNVASEAGHTVVLHSDDSSPSEIYALEGGAKLRKLTHHNDAFMAGLQLSTVEDMRFNSADGTPIHGLVVKPPGYVSGRRYPTVLYIHGGPDLQDEHSFAFDGYQFKRQMLAASGFVVCGINYRGSAGKGDAFSRAIAADWGRKEVEDLLGGIDYLVQAGIADPDKLGIGGWSYGGMLTDYTIASTTRFKAAMSGAGTGNPLALYAADQYNIQYGAELGEPWRNTDLYVKLAYPLLHADRIHTPTLFMGGDKDFNVPIVGGEQMYLALRTLGVPAELIVYPGQFHTLTRPSFLKDRAERMAAWYSKYLLSSPPP
jgi:dipeptidyl aminopeptidase/acylaminoacyl peptidase